MSLTCPDFPSLTVEICFNFSRKDGYDERTNEQRWSFSASLMFALRYILYLRNSRRGEFCD